MTEMEKPEKTHLNRECAKIAKRELTPEDYINLSKIAGKPQSHIVEVIAGRRKTESYVIDYIQKACVQKLKNAVKIMENRK